MAPLGEPIRTDVFQYKTGIVDGLGKPLSICTVPDSLEGPNDLCVFDGGCPACAKPSLGLPVIFERVQFKATS